MCAPVGWLALEDAFACLRLGLGANLRRGGAWPGPPWGRRALGEASDSERGAVRRGSKRANSDASNSLESQSQPSFGRCSHLE